MIDFHTHILPDLDDGACFWDESLAMARKAREEGLSGIVLTPHYIERQYRNTRRRIWAKVEEMRFRLLNAGISIEVYPGAEVRVEPGVIDSFHKNELMTVNDGNRYLLVELPFFGLPDYVNKVLEGLLELGVTPIIAHPERHREVIRNPRWLYSLVARGALVQLNSQSITGEYGAEIYAAAIDLARNGMIHLLGSDAHSLPVRPPGFAGALERLKKILSPAWLGRIVADNPAAVLEGEKI